MIETVAIFERKNCTNRLIFNKLVWLLRPFFEGDGYAGAFQYKSVARHLVLVVSIL